jgi:hypothetical protein
MSCQFMSCEIGDQFLSKQQRTTVSRNTAKLLDFFVELENNLRFESILIIQV